MIKKFALALLALALLSPAYVYAAPGSIFVDLEGKSVNVNYDVEGVEVISVTPDLDFISLIFEVEVTGSPGILEITFERNFFDATFQGADDVFIVIADGDEPDSEEIATTAQSRTLRIELPAGTDEVEIIGTEFVMEDPPTMEDPPKTEEPKTEEPKTECGPGTVLKDGVCVVKCGPGTIFQDGECVASPSAKKGDVSVSRDFISGGGIALGIALLMILFFAIIARASR